MCKQLLNLVVDIWVFTVPFFTQFYVSIYFTIMLNKISYVLPACHFCSTVRCQQPRTLPFPQGFSPSAVAGDLELQAPHWASGTRLALCSPKFPKTELIIDVEVGGGARGGGRHCLGRVGLGLLKCRGSLPTKATHRPPGQSRGSLSHCCLPQAALR